MSTNGIRLDQQNIESEGPNEHDYDDRDHFKDDDPLDAFNEETFAGGLDGYAEDWETQHDQMILLEHDGKIDPEIPLLTEKFNRNLEFNQRSSSNVTNNSNLVQQKQEQEKLTNVNSFQNFISKIKVPASSQLANASGQSASIPSGKVKTLEEIEQELLSSRNDTTRETTAKRVSPLSHTSSIGLIQPPNRQSPASFPPNIPINQAQIQQHQQQQMELLKLLPLLNIMQQQQQQPQVSQIDEQKQSSNVNQEQKMLLLQQQQQQQMMEQLNINRVLTSNSVTIQQRQFIVAQLQKNLQTIYLQIQLLQQRQVQSSSQSFQIDEQQQLLYQTVYKQLQQQQQQLQLQLQQQQQLLLQQHIQIQQAQLQQHLHKQQQQQNQTQIQQQSELQNLSQSKSDFIIDDRSDTTSNRSQFLNNSFTNRNQRHTQNNNQTRRTKHFNSQNGGGGDKLAGIMTDKEKNWVTNVQMLQLHVEDSYREDFYYTAWMKKKEKFTFASTILDPTASNSTKVPSLNVINKHDPKNYKPKTFENSLGKLTISNFHHPRALIELIKPTHENDDKSKEPKNICTILLEIEKMYQLYLEIDEIEHDILKAREEQRINLFQDRRAKVEKLLATLCNENFAHYLFVQKGKRLLGKCLPTFNTSQTKLILALIMQYIYVISKNNISLDDIYSQITNAIDTQKFTDLVEIVHTFVHLYTNQPFQIYNTILLNKFGLTYLLKFISKSELVTQDEYEIEIKNIWSVFLNLILNAMYNLTNTNSINLNSNLKMSTNETYYLNVHCILDEFQVNRQLWHANELKLGELFCLVYN